MSFPIKSRTYIINRKKTIQLNRLKAIGGLTFSKNYMNNRSSLNADYSLGSATATYTATRSASAPATYVDSAGVVQLLTTSNVRRRQGGYYDATGFHAQSGEMVEAAGTNLLIRTDGTATDAGSYGNEWIGWSVAGISSFITGTPTSSVVAIPELTSISSAVSQRIQYTGIVTDTSKDISVISQSTGSASVVNGNVVTLSFYARSQSGISGCRAVSSIKIRDSGSSLLSTNTAAFSTISTSWRKFSQTLTVVNATADRANIYIGVDQVDDTDIVDIEVYGVQLEVSPYATSFIPTTTAALTRGAEVLKYPIANNRTAAAETIFFKFATGWAATSPTTALHLLDSDADKVSLALIAASDSFSYYPNATDDAATTVTDTVDPSINTSYVIAAVSYGATAGTNTEIYNNGVSKATSTTNYTQPDNAGTSFYVGSRNDSTLQINGIIQSVAIYNRALTAAEVVAVYNILQTGGL